MSGVLVSVPAMPVGVALVALVAGVVILTGADAVVRVLWVSDGCFGVLKL